MIPLHVTLVVLGVYLLVGLAVTRLLWGGR